MFRLATIKLGFNTRLLPNEEDLYLEELWPAGEQRERGQILVDLLGAGISKAFPSFSVDLWKLVEYLE